MAFIVGEGSASVWKVARPQTPWESCFLGFSSDLQCGALLSALSVAFPSIRTCLSVLSGLSPGLLRPAILSSMQDGSPA